MCSSTVNKSTRNSMLITVLKLLHHQLTDSRTQTEHSTCYKSTPNHSMATKWLCASESNIAVITAIHSDHVRSMLLTGTMISHQRCQGSIQWKILQYCGKNSTFLAGM